MAASDSRSKQPGQVSNLPGVFAYITGHNESTGKAVIQSARPGKWSSYDDSLMDFSIVYTTSEFPASLNLNVDIKKHDNLMTSGKLGLVNPGGTVCRIVDFAPGFDCAMHRTQSLDYGVVLEGSIELLLDSDQIQLMQRGDVAVQRATMHSWRNPNCQKITIRGRSLKEDLGRGVEGLPPSGNA
ncbi:hypothetical protein F5884DRAFT_822889 [Xylogone sp. PMI_703]|nr:hypothetical protein F5884DRAFT_822889 [Xylogone sp. PMI_703]